MAPRSVLFVCTHNAGRSQMAAGYLAQLGGDAFVVNSAGTAPADAMNPAVVAAMLEEGVDLRDAEPTLLTPELAAEADLIVALGVDSAILPGRAYEVWDFPDPAGVRLEAVRPIRDAIKQRVQQLLHDLSAPAVA